MKKEKMNEIIRRKEVWRNGQILPFWRPSPQASSRTWWKMKKRRRKKKSKGQDTWMLLMFPQSFRILEKCIEEGQGRLSWMDGLL